MATQLTQPTRRQYMDKEVSFADFYRAVNQTAGISLERNPIIAEVKTALEAGDEHLNTIPLQHWDAMAFSVQQALTKAFKEHGDSYSLAGGVCAMKQAARDAVKDAA